MLTSQYLTFSNRLNRLFGDVWGGYLTSDNGTPGWIPPVDVVEENGDIRISVELPGVKPEDVKVSVENSVLSIEGQKPQRGTFARAFTLPSTVDAERIKALYEHGVLTLSLPRIEQAKPRQIAIESVK